MSAQEQQSYTIQEATKLTGLTSSTLRYYETIGLIPPIRRHSSSKYRIYSEDNINYIVSIACLSATGMSIDAMQEYLKNVDIGVSKALAQVTLLEDQNTRLIEEERNLKLRQKYLRTKADYWKAIAGNDQRLAAKISEQAIAIAKEVKLSRTN